ncbi:MAG TPA: delta-60 repeat domain-containing protein [Streptosporangiaceae bacterium]|jgi:hypothetical protein
MRTRRWLAAGATAALLIGGASVGAGGAASADTAQPTVVSANPVDFTPNIKDGTVRGVAVIGDKVIVGGSFTTVIKKNVSYTRRSLLAFDRTTGAIDPDFVPDIDGEVYQLAPGPGHTVFVGGTFTHVNGAVQGGITQLSTDDGSQVASFAGAHLNNGTVRTVRTSGPWVYIGGSFTKVNGQPRTTIARLAIANGALDPNFDFTMANPTSTASGLKAMKLAVSPDGTKVVVDGTFTTVNGQSRPRIAMLDTSGTVAALANWRTARYQPSCPVDVYTRGIDFSPDGSYFVVVTTGGPTTSFSTLCDGAARWESGATGTALNPTWVNYTGGDSLYETSVTGAAVYVGGHQRWLDNPYGHDSAGAGAVSRPGIGAIDPVTGKALAWNPTKDRGHGVEALVATADGLYIGSDTGNIGGEWRERIAEMPLP